MALIKLDDTPSRLTSPFPARPCVISWQLQGRRWGPTWPWMGWDGMEDLNLNEQ